MQIRHIYPEMYFEEMSISCRNYYIPFLADRTDLKFDSDCHILEIGCGFGGILSVFAENGCRVTGIDINKRAIDTACSLFTTKGLNGTFICSNIFDYNNRDIQYDLIILHDCIEHIGQKEELMISIRKMLKKEGTLYVGFPPWQMPFGGHQQMAKNRFLANCPYVHLLPKSLFALLFKVFRQRVSDIDSFFGIRDTRITIEQFERLVKTASYNIKSRQFYFINPNYHIKFGLLPRKLYKFIAAIPYVRNYFTTTCYYLLSKS